MPYRIQTYQHLVVVRWLGQPAPGEPSAVFATVEATHARVKRPLVYIGVHGDDSIEPGPDARREAIAGWDAGMRHVDACYHVLARSSMVATLQRSFYRLMLLAGRVAGVRSLSKMHFVASVDEALAALGANLPMPVFELREQIRRDGLSE